MTNETKVTLTPEQVAARAAALLAAANKPADVKPVTPQVTALPGMAPLGVKPVTAPNTAPHAPLAPAAATRSPAAHTEPQQGTPNQTATPTAPKVETPTGEAGKATTTVQGDRGPAPAKVDTGTQGGKATTANPHTNPVKPSNGQGGTKGGTKGGKGKTPTVTVEAAKAKKPKSQRDAALADTSRVAGYDLARWPKSFAGIDQPERFKPTEVDILVARALGQGASMVTINELNLAAELGRNVFTVKRSNDGVHVEANVNVYSIGDLAAPVLGRSGDHKMNHVSKVVRQGKAGFLTSNGKLISGPTARASETGLKHSGKQCYGVKLTKLGVKLAEQVLGVGKVPGYMLPPEPAHKAADASKGATPAK